MFFMKNLRRVHWSFHCFSASFLWWDGFIAGIYRS